MAGGTRIVSTHLSPMKDRSLATALLRMSERRGLQDDFFGEKVVYCGSDEPFNGWTNIVPTARYSEHNRPRDPVEMIKRKKNKPKPKQNEIKDSMSDVYSELLGVTSRADGHYHASATMQELYEEYKKRQSIEDQSKFRCMVDPITFRYIPIEDRMEEYESDDGSVVKLPVLKMTHANKQAKLLEILESFMNRKPEDQRTDTEKYSVKGKDAALFYDKYRWYFRDKKGNLSKNMKIKKRSKKAGRKKGGSIGYYSGSESEDSGGIRRHIRQSNPPSYVIQVKDDESNTLKEETITFERKVDYALSAPGAPGIDRWVARVIIRDASSKTDGDTMTSSTVSQTTMKSSNSQIEKLKSLRTKQPPQTQKQQPEYRLTKRKNKNRRRLPSSFYEVYHLSSYETTKVQMKFNIKAGRRQGDRIGNSDSTPSIEGGAGAGEDVQQTKKKKVKPAPVHPRKNLDTTGKLEPKTQKVLPQSKKPNLDEKQGQDAKIPLPPIKTKRSPQSSDTASKGSKSNKRQRIANPSKEDGPLFSKQRAFESSEERQVKTPSSSTFNPDRMFRQMKDTADFITKASALSKASKSIHSSTRFISQIEDARTADGQDSFEGLSTKPLHPKHNKNRVQDKIQQMIDDEKAIVSQVIKRLNTDWRSESPGKLESVPESLEDALSTAIAKARIYDAQHGLNSGRLTSNQMMKRRVVPPVKEKSLPTTTVGSNESLFITDRSRTFSTMKPKLPAFKPSTIGKKQDSKGHTFTKSVRSLSNDRNDTYRANKLQPGTQFIADGDLVITKPRKNIPGIFEASISSIKPSRRIANVN